MSDASGAPPLVSIGMPVYNGQRFIAEAIESALAQTWPDLELIVCDNGSTDDTPRIVRTYVERDRRIRSFRRQANVGPAANFNRAFRLSRGRYFKWLAADDVCGPEFIARCLSVLEADASLVLCSARFVEIDERGEVIGPQGYQIDLSAVEPHERLGRLMCTRKGHPILYGLIRSDALRRTHLLAPYHGSDRALLAELALLGPFRELPDELWRSRDHPGRSPYVRRTRDGWKGSAAGPPLAHAAIAAHMLRVILTAPLDRTERVRCLGRLARCIAGRLDQLLPDLADEVRELAADPRRAVRRSGRRDPGRAG